MNIGTNVDKFHTFIDTQLNPQKPGDPSFRPGSGLP